MRPRIAKNAVSRGRQAGLTLLEVLIALTVLSFMLIMVWFTTSSSIDVKNNMEVLQEREHEVRVAMNRIVKDLQASYLSANEVVNLDNRRTLFVGKSARPVDELRFSSLGHRVLWAESNESEQTWIAYSAEDDPEDRSKTNLVRYESRRLSNEPWKSEPAEIDVLLRDIERVEFEYFNWEDNEWQDSWDTTKIDAEKDRLPERARITVTLRAEDGDGEYKRVSQARISMQEQLKF